MSPAGYLDGQRSGNPPLEKFKLREIYTHKLGLTEAETLWSQIHNI